MGQELWLVFPDDAEVTAAHEDATCSVASFNRRFQSCCRELLGVLRCIDTAFFAGGCGMFIDWGFPVRLFPLFLENFVGHIFPPPSSPPPPILSPLCQAALARKTYGGTTFRVVSIQSAIKDLKDDACQLQIVVNPGFNVDEWIVLDKLARPDVPMVMLNGGLDRVGGNWFEFDVFFPVSVGLFLPMPLLGVHG